MAKRTAKSILVLDNAMYVDEFIKRMKAEGYRVSRADLEDVAERIAKRGWGLLLFDPEMNELFGPSDHQLSETDAEILRAALQKEIPVTIYTRMQKESFDKQARAMGIDPGSVSFFSKRSDVPPVLDSMRDEIVHNPYLVSGYIEDQIPQWVTKEWLEREPAVYTYLAEYVVRHMRETDEVDTPTALPAGLQRIWLMLQLDGSVHNGGFEQFFDGGTGPSGKDRYIGPTIEAARQFGLNAIGDLVEKAHKLWTNFLQDHPSLLGEDIPSEKHKLDSRAAWEEFEAKVEPRFAEMEREFYSLGLYCGQGIRAYCRAHPEEFLLAK